MLPGEKVRIATRDASTRFRYDSETELAGFFEVELIDFSHSEQAYQTNTPILDTTLYDTNGGSVRISDVAPRYEYVGRMFTPMMLLRRIEPVSGSPRIRIRLRPARDYGSAPSDWQAMLLALLIACVAGQMIAWVYMLTHSGLSYSKSFVNFSIAIVILTVTDF